MRRSTLVVALALLMPVPLSWHVTVPVTSVHNQPLVVDTFVKVSLGDRRACRDDDDARTLPASTTRPITTAGRDSDSGCGDWVSSSASWQDARHGDHRPSRFEGILRQSAP
jgi:hypothetical protein